MGGRGSSSSGGSGSTGGRLVSTASLASRIIALPGGGVDKVRMDRIKEALKAGKDLGPVKLLKLPNGKLFVEDGRHRLLASHQLGIPVRIKVEKGDAGAEAHTVRLLS